MKKYPKFHVQKRNLLAIAGCVWVSAGVNVARLGIIEYLKIVEIDIRYIVLSMIVFLAFGSMFYKMSKKHYERIISHEDETRAFWHFFDLKSYPIMTFMMSGGIWLRSSGLAPAKFISFFCTGLGCALAMAGVSFLWMYFTYKGEE